MNTESQVKSHPSQAATIMVPQFTNVFEPSNYTQPNRSKTRARSEIINEERLGILAWLNALVKNWGTVQLPSTLKETNESRHLIAKLLERPNHPPPKQERFRHYHYQCPECDAVFTRKKEFESHLTQTHGERNHICPDCQVSFCNTSSLAKHQRRSRQRGYCRNRKTYLKHT
jgi:hypothetical protein